MEVRLTKRQTLFTPSAFSLNVSVTRSPAYNPPNILIRIPAEEPIYNIDSFPGFETDGSWVLSSSSQSFDKDLNDMINGIMDAPKPLKKTLNNNVKN